MQMKKITKVQHFWEKSPLIDQIPEKYGKDLMGFIPRGGYVMKRIEKRSRRVLLFMMLCALLCNIAIACGNAGKEDMKTGSAADYQNAETAYGIQNHAEMDMESAKDSKVVSDEGGSETAVSAGNGENAAAYNSSQKIIKDYYYDYETERFDDAYAYLKNQIDKCQGYVSSSDISGSNYRTLRMTARIPADACDGFISSMGNLGTVVSQSESAEDVTLQYADTESRIVSFKTEQERLNELLEKADNLENIIALEDRLTEVRYELENYQSQKKLYDSLIAYSTVNITLEEVNYTVTIDESTFMSRITTGLEKSFRDIKNGFINFLVAFIVALPYLVIWGVVLGIIIWMIRKIVKRRKRKKQERRNQQMGYAVSEGINRDQEKAAVMEKETNTSIVQEETSGINKE